MSAKPTLDAAERARREAAAYDEDRVWERNHAWNLRVPHFKPGRIEVEADVTRCPHCRTGIVPRDSSPRILTPCSGRPPE